MLQERAAASGREPSAVTLSPGLTWTRGRPPPPPAAESRVSARAAPPRPARLCERFPGLLTRAGGRVAGRSLGHVGEADGLLEQVLRLEIKAVGVVQSLPRVGGSAERLRRSAEFEPLPV